MVELFSFFFIGGTPGTPSNYLTGYESFTSSMFMSNIFHTPKIVSSILTSAAAFSATDFRLVLQM